MERTFTNRSYLDAMQNKVMVFDGAMGTNLQLQNLTAEHFGGEKTNGCNDYLVISYPQAVETVHRSFLAAGVDVIETGTFRSNRITLREYGLADRVIEINVAAARLARSCADDFRKDWSAAFCGWLYRSHRQTSSMDDPELSNVTFDELSG